MRWCVIQVQYMYNFTTCNLYLLQNSCHKVKQEMIISWTHTWRSDRASKSLCSTHHCFSTNWNMNINIDGMFEFKKSPMSHWNKRQWHAISALEHIPMPFPVLWDKFCELWYNLNRLSIYKHIRPCLLIIELIEQPFQIHCKSYWAICSYWWCTIKMLAWAPKNHPWYRRLSLQLGGKTHKINKNIIL